MHWIQLHPRANGNNLGYIPQFLSERDSRDIRAQINDNYRHGGGWFPYGKGDWQWDRDANILHYPGDPLFSALWMTKLRDEELYVFQHAIVLVQFGPGPDDFEVARLD